MRKLISYKDALKITLKNMPKVGWDKIGIEKGLKRVLAEDVFSKIDSPPFPKASMDGFAVLARDTFEAEKREVFLKVIDKVFAGETPKKSVSSGFCVEVATGAMMPEGADAVVMVEHVEKEKGRIKILKPVPPLKNVSLKGEDVKRGDLVLRKGKVLKPQDIAILKSLGVKEILVAKKPRIGIIVTGSELSQNLEDLKPGKIIESNSIMLSLLCENFFSQPKEFGVVEDDEGKIKKVIENAKKSCDVLLITGGSSVGEKDLVLKILKNMLYHEVLMRPGKPIGFAYDEVPIFVMSGYPVACFVQFYAFVLPAIEKMLGVERKKFKVSGNLKENIVSTLGRRDYVRVKIEDGIFPVRKRGSGVLSSLISDAFLVVPENVEGFEAGEEVDVEIFDLVYE